MQTSIKKEQHFFFRYKLHHVVFWLSYGAMWYVFGQLSTPPEHRGLTGEAIAINMVYLVTHITASYINMYVLMPRFLLKKRYVPFALLLLLDIFIFSALIALGFYIVFRNNPYALESIFRLESIIPATLFSVASTVGGLSAAKLYQSRRRSERRNAQLEKEKLEAELNYLKAQINPHFLFNAINNIYFMIMKDKELAADMLLKFSELLRYQLYECNTDYIPIDTELAYLRNYVDLEKVRKEKVSVKFDGELNGNFKIAPLLLIPFVENAFKHVSVTAGKHNFIDITLKYEYPYFSFTVINSKNTEHHAAARTGGIGIKNATRRLELLYPGKHELVTDAGGDNFRVHLKLNTAHED